MATLTTWQVRNNVLQLGNGVITLLVAGAGANEILSLNVLSPDGMNTPWEVKCDELGRVAQDIYPANGVGVYTISFTGATPNYTNTPINVSVQAQAAGAAIASISLQVTPTYASVGGTVTIAVVGFPNTVALVQHGWQGGAEQLQVQLDSSGIGTITTSVKSLLDQFIATNQLLVSNVVAIKVPLGSNIPAPVVPDSVVTITQLPTTGVIQDEVLPVTLQIVNHDGVTRYLWLNSSTGSLQLEMPLPSSYITLPSGVTIELTLFVSAHNTEIVNIPMELRLVGLHGTNSSTPTVGTAVNYGVELNIPPRNLTPQFNIVWVTATPSTQLVGVAVVVKMKLVNTGELDLTNVTLAPIQLPNVSGTISFSGLSIPRGGFIIPTSTITPLQVGGIELDIDATTISASSSSGNLVGTGLKSTYIIVK